MKKILYVLIAIIIIVGAILVFGSGNKLSGQPTVASDFIKVSAPLGGATISSPVHITGTAKGNWYFEAVFPIIIKDLGGKIVGQGPAHAEGDWMTDSMVPFVADISFAPQPKGSEGFIVLRNDNPSGLPENEKSIVLPIKF